MAQEFLVAPVLLPRELQRSGAGDSCRQGRQRDVTGSFYSRFHDHVSECRVVVEGPVRSSKGFHRFPTPRSHRATMSIDRSTGAGGRCSLVHPPSHPSTTTINFP